MKCQKTGLAYHWKGRCTAETPQHTKLALTALPGFSLLSLSSVVAILLLICLPPLHKICRRLFRPLVVFHVERGLEWVEYAQKNQRKLLTRLCSISCFAVSIPFYITFLPILTWCGELQLGARLVTLMSFCEFVGNGVKDLICAPRPMGHPKGAGKTRLLLSEKSMRGIGKEDAKVHSLEYGLPSSHTMHSLCLNFYMVHYVISRGVVPQHWAFFLYPAAALWVAWIGFARVYMGMHTPIDILGGAIIAVMVLSSYLSVDDRYESWILQDKYAVIKQLVCSALLLKLHPLPMQYTPSYVNSVIFNGVAWGYLAGLRLSHTPEQLDRPLEQRLYTSLQAWPILLIRMVLGFFGAAFCKEVGKAVALKVLSPIYAAFPMWLRQAWRPPIYSLQPESPLSKKGIPVDEHGKPYDVATTSRFLAYAALSYWCVGPAFRVFWFLESRLPFQLP